MVAAGGAAAREKMLRRVKYVPLEYRAGWADSHCANSTLLVFVIRILGWGG